LINNPIVSEYLSGYAETTLKCTLMKAYTAYTGKWYNHGYYVKALKELSINIEKQARNLHIFFHKGEYMNFNTYDCYN
jgi:hypothetical protein